MIFYLSIVFTVVLVFLFSRWKFELSPVLVWLPLPILVFVAGVRSGVGVDFETYVGFLKEISLGVDTYMELGFETFVALLYKLGGNDQLIFFSVSFATITAYVVGIFNFSRDKALSLALFTLLPFFYLASFNQIRQFLVASIFFLMLGVVVRNYFIASLLIAVLSLFHKVSLLYFPLLLMGRSLRSPLFYVAIFVVFIVVCKLASTFVVSLGFSAAYLSEYTSSGLDVRGLFFLAFWMLMYRHCYSKEFCNPIVIASLNLLFLMVLVMLAPVFSEGIASAELLRISSLYSFSLLILIPIFVAYASRFSGISYHLISSFILCIALFYFIWTLSVSGSAYKLLPFNTTSEFFR